MPVSSGLHPGLCATCRHCRAVETDRSTFYLCERSLHDPRYRKYPILPVVHCPGHEPWGGVVPGSRGASA